MYLYKNSKGIISWKQGNPSDVSSSSSTISTKSFIAGTAISSGKVLIIETDGKVYPFDVNNPDHFDKYLGVAYTAATIGNSCDVVMEGIVNVSGTGWIAGVSYYIAASSLPTSIPPISGLVKEIGVGVENDSILLNGVLEVETI